jgi:hypothetical protein
MRVTYNITLFWYVTPFILVDGYEDLEEPVASIIRVENIPPKDLIFRHDAM